MNRKTYKRKTYKRKTYRKKTYKRKRGGNLLIKTGQVGQKIITNPNIRSGFGDMAKGTLGFTKEIGERTAKGYVQTITPKVINKVANYNTNQYLPTIPLSSGMGYLPPPPPTNNYKIAPPPATDMSTINQ